MNVRYAPQQTSEVFTYLVSLGVESYMIGYLIRQKSIYAGCETLAEGRTKANVTATMVMTTIPSAGRSSCSPYVRLAMWGLTDEDCQTMSWHVSVHPAEQQEMNALVIMNARWARVLRRASMAANEGLSPGVSPAGAWRT